jgi:hypothetical protein
MDSKKQTKLDVNGKESSKRKWAGIILRYAIVYTSVMGVAKLLIVFGILTPVMEFEVDTALILGLFTVGAGLFGVTTFERQNTLPINNQPSTDTPNEGLN